MPLRGTKDFGFETSVVGEQKHNVLCVTKVMGKPRDHADFHFGITGTAVVKTLVHVSSAMEMHETVIGFDGQTYELDGVRNGLSGTCLTIGIKTPDDPHGYDVWELYTDTPSAKPDRPEQVVTPELIRKIAEVMLKDSPNCDRR